MFLFAPPLGVRRKSWLLLYVLVLGCFGSCPGGAVASGDKGARTCAARRPDSTAHLPPYTAAADAHLLLGPALGPPSATRSRNGPSYALIAPDSRVFGEAPRGWSNGATAAAVVTPALGAHFAMYLVRVPRGGRIALRTVFDGAAPRLQRFLFILTGAMAQFEHETQDINLGSGQETSKTRFDSGSYIFVGPGNDTTHNLVALEDVALIQIDKPYSYPRGQGIAPGSVHGSCEEIAPEVPRGEVFQLRRLLDPTYPGFDFNIHVMDFEPGEYLVTKEMHYNQHGLMMLSGEGLYMLGSEYMPVRAGDFIWMAPFCLQWYAALGTDVTRYFLYKDTSADPLLHVQAPVTEVSPADT